MPGNLIVYSPSPATASPLPPLSYIMLAFHVVWVRASFRQLSMTDASSPLPNPPAVAVIVTQEFGNGSSGSCETSPTTGAGFDS